MAMRDAASAMRVQGRESPCHLRGDREGFAEDLSWEAKSGSISAGRNWKGGIRQG